jgi:uncharacterized protein YecT (DUF1311 family)
MRHLPRSLAVLLLLAAYEPVQAQTKVAEQIEAGLKKALETPEGQTTRSMVEANDHAVQAYAREILRVYGLLRQGLPRPQKQALEKAQAAWLKYLESQRLVTSYIYDAPGTIHRAMGSAALKQVLQHRLAELCELFLDGGGETPFSEAVPGRESWCGEVHQRLQGSDPLGDLAGARPVRKAKVNHP